MFSMQSEKGCQSKSSLLDTVTPDTLLPVYPHNLVRVWPGLLSAVVILTTFCSIKKGVRCLYVGLD
jgi:hypothetical protein